MYDKNNHIEEQDAFLKGFSEKLQNFEVPVDAECWSEIEARMQQKKRRIVPFWWWMSGGAAAVAIILLSISVLMQKPETGNSTAALMESSDSINTTNTHQPAPEVQITEKENFAVTKTKNLQSLKSVLSVSEATETLTDTTKAKVIPTQDAVQIALAKEDSSRMHDIVTGIKDRNQPVENNIASKNDVQEPVKDWTENFVKPDDKQTWFLAVAAGTGNSGNSVSTFAPAYTDALRSSIVGVAAKNTYIFAPEDFDNQNFYAPVSVSFLVGKKLNKTLKIETGLNYTFLMSHFSDTNIDADLTLHYLGLPVNITADLLKLNKLTLYASAGGMVEKGLRSVYEQHQYWGTQIIITNASTKISGLQWSVNSSVGAAYQLKNKIQLYLEPEFAYFFDNNQPISIRTTRPVVVGVNAGCKIEL